MPESSNDDPHLELQREVLGAFGCGRMFEDTAAVPTLSEPGWRLWPSLSAT
ncbi:hypothetical protein [Pseudomonas sp. McL0111]|uniref:hypothetical protein n=1 Tax=Pseudomonas sp. McL0111 TaxID=3457357 RepID=UPI00403ED1E0